MKLKQRIVGAIMLCVGIAIGFAAIVGFVWILSTCLISPTKEKLIEASLAEPEIMTFLQKELQADKATVKLEIKDSCGTVQTDVIFRKAGAADDGKEHSATFNGNELKFLDGDFYIPPAIATLQ